MREWYRDLGTVAIASVVLIMLIVFFAAPWDQQALWWWIGRAWIVVGLWYLFGPLWESGRAQRRCRRSRARTLSLVSRRR